MWVSCSRAMACLKSSSGSASGHGRTALDNAETTALRGSLPRPIGGLTVHGTDHAVTALQMFTSPSRAAVMACSMPAAESPHTDRVY